MIFPMLLVNFACICSIKHPFLVPPLYARNLPSCCIDCLLLPCLANSHMHSTQVRILLLFRFQEVQYGTWNFFIPYSSGVILFQQGMGICFFPAFPYLFLHALTYFDLGHMELFHKLLWQHLISFLLSNCCFTTKLEYCFLKTLFYFLCSQSGSPSLFLSIALFSLTILGLWNKKIRSGNSRLLNRTKGPSYGWEFAS